MTNAEAYKAIFSKYGGSISDSDVAADLGLVGIDPDADYDPNNACSLYATALSRMANDNKGIQSVSEGGYSITYDKADKANQLYLIAQDSGCSSLIDKYNPNPKVKNKSYLW